MSAVLIIIDHKDGESEILITMCGNILNSRVEVYAGRWNNKGMS